MLHFVLLVQKKGLKNIAKNPHRHTHWQDRFYYLDHCRGRYNDVNLWFTGSQPPDFSWDRQMISGPLHAKYGTWTADADKFCCQLCVPNAHTCASWWSHGANLFPECTSQNLNPPLRNKFQNGFPCQGLRVKIWSSQMLHRICLPWSLLRDPWCK